MQWAVRLACCLTLVSCGQVLAAPNTAELRVGNLTLKRERWLVDALQQRLFMRVSALRQFFRVRPGSGPPCPLLCARCPRCPGSPWRHLLHRDKSRMRQLVEALPGGGPAAAPHDSVTHAL